MKWNIIKTALKSFFQDFKEMERRNYWNNKWPMNDLTYSALGKFSMDVRNLIVSRSNILDKYLKLFDEFKTDDEKALKVLEFVTKELRYKSDDVYFGRAEWWQHPELTIQLGSGDCEDFALLIASLLRCSGVPAYKIKVCAGWVKIPGNKKGGHAYCIYLADDNEWYVLDGTYYANQSIKNFKKIPHKNNKNYLDIWWTFNDTYSWNQKSMNISDEVK